MIMALAGECFWPLTIVGFFLRVVDEAAQLERRLNNRPRNSLIYRTPKEVFTRAVALQR
jgi:IS30 family transposase